MPIELKQILNGGLDTDTAFGILPKGAYVDALNITHDAVNANEDNYITQPISNVRVPYNYPEGKGVVINVTPFPLRNTVIFFRYNSNQKHGIYEYNATTGAVSKILECFTDTDTDILNFTENGKITSVNIYPREIEGDLIFFLDSLGRPTGFDIARVRAGEYNPVTRQIINVIKAPPLVPPSCVFGNDPTTTSNYFQKKSVRFAYVWQYDTFEESVLSPWSLVTPQINILDPVYTNVISNNNVIFLSLNNGDKNVKTVKILASFSSDNDWSDFQVIATLDKSEIGLSQRATIEPGAMSQSNATIYFTGSIVTGTNIKVYLTTLPNTDTIVADYTIVDGDTFSSVLAFVAAQINGSGFVVSASVPGTNTILIKYLTATYLYSRTVITNAVLPDNTSFSYQFYNDSTYPIYNVLRQAELQDYVPDFAKSQETPNGNVLAYAGITEGLSRDLIPDVVNLVLTYPVTGGSTGNLTGSYKQLHSGLYLTFQVTVNGIPAVGTVINIKFKRLSDSAIVLAATYTTISGDTTNQIITGLYNSMAALALAIPTLRNTYQFEFDFLNFLYDFSSLEIIAPSISTTANSIATWKWSTSRNIGIAYFDQNGKTNGILYNARVNFPAYAEDGADILLPYINTKIFHRPPLWAYSFTFSFTKEPTKWIFWESSDVITTETDFLYFNVSGFKANQLKYPTTAPVLNYSFTPGDRMRLIKNTTSGLVFSDAYDTAIEGLVTDPKISGTTTVGDFIKIKKLSPFDTPDFSSKFFVIELYTPGQTEASKENETYCECGLEFLVSNPGTENRTHNGQVTGQVIDISTSTNIPAEFNFYDGDSFFRPRTIALSDTGVATFNVQDRNFVDFYLSAVNSFQGRANIIDKNSKPTFFGAVIRFGQAYQANTNINGFNQFYPLDFIEGSYGFGIIERMKARDKKLLLFQTNKVGYSPLFSQIHRDSAKGELIAQTDRLLNPIQYYSGDWGIGTAATSLASFNFADYFCDNIRGAICRLSLDGIKPISILYKNNSWANDELTKRVGDIKIYGAFDQRLSNYVFSLEAALDSPATTRIFDEENNFFDSRLSYTPEAMGCLGTLFISCKDGEFYTHNGNSFNEFYGVKYPSSISIVFNDKNAVRKKYNAIGYQSKGDKIWYCPEIYTNTKNSQTGLMQQSSLIEEDFVLEETVLTAALLRDKNSMQDEDMALLEGDFLGGNWILIKFEISAENANGLVSLLQPYLFYEISQRNF
jgi:hypothetical protein